MADRAPSRSILVPAALFTQIAGALCILLGTVATALTLTTGGERILLPVLIGWVVAALSTIVCGGMIYRGNLPAIIMAALLDGVFGIVLLQVGRRLSGLLRMLSAEDVAFVGTIIIGMSIGILATVGLCLLAIPQARRYQNYLAREMNPGASITGMFKYESRTPPDDDRDAAATDPNGPVIPDAASTAPGFPPPPPHMLQQQLPTMTLRVQVQQGKRRLWFAVVGLAIGIGSGIAVLTATRGSGAGLGAECTTELCTRCASPGTGSSGSVAGSSSSGSASASASASSAACQRCAGVCRTSDRAGGAAGRVGGAGSGGVAGSQGTTAPDPVAAGSDSAGSAAMPVVPGKRPPGITTAQDLLVAEHTAIGKVNIAELAALAAPNAFAFGIDADGVAEGPAAIQAMLERDLLGGQPPPADGIGIDGKFIAMGEWRDHAWIAEEIEIVGTFTRRYVITQLAAKIDGEYAVVAWHWAIAVPDAIAEKHAKAGTLPKLAVIPDHHDGSDELDSAVRASLASRDGFGEAWSTRADAYNFGSAGERLVGGAMIKKLFTRMRADLALQGASTIVSGDAWDKTQKSGAWIAFAAANVAFAPAGHPSQTFRVLAIYIKEDDRWELVQTQFSNGGPIPEVWKP